MGTIAEAWIEEGIVLGKQEGERQALRKSIERILLFRFETLPADFVQSLSKLGLKGPKTVKRVGV